MKCKSVSALWEGRGAPIVECAAPQDHRGIRVTLTGAAWDHLGEERTRSAFAQSLVTVYKSHWAQFHDDAWKREPKRYLVAIWVTRATSLDPKMVATANAAGGFAEED
jgi:hypothetical protein